MATTGQDPSALVAATLLAGAALDAISTVLYIHAARLALRVLPRGRDHSAEAFALFWFGVGIVNALQAGLELLAVFRDPGLAIAFAVWNTRIVLVLVSFAGLVYYLLYVYTGSAASRGPLIAFYATAFLLMQVWLMQAQPVAADASGWRVDLVFAGTTETPLYKLVVVLFFVPPMLAAGAYAFLLRSVSGGAQLRRARFLAASLGVYFAGLTFGYLSPGWVWWGLVENLLGIGAAAGAILAFLPPVARSLAPRAYEDALTQRLRELV